MTKGFAVMQANWEMLGIFGSALTGVISAAESGIWIIADDNGNDAVSVDSMSCLWELSWALSPSSSSRTFCNDRPKEASAATLPSDSACTPSR